MAKKSDSIGTNLKVLFRHTPPKTMKKKDSVRIKKKSYARTRDGFHEGRFLLRSKEPTTERKPQEHRVLVVKTDQARNRFWIHCSCEDFIFRWEYALTQHRSSAIVGGNGQPALITNPQNLPGMCIHCARVLTTKSVINRMNRK